MPQALWHRNRVGPLSDGVRRLSDLPVDEARAELRACGAGTEWAERMLSQRPFKSRDEVFEAAERFWTQVSPGERFESVRQRLEKLLER